eukprot:TRINITY_DN5332_c0_g2_i1.p1 TRINITY_DN5332_c0_g2~~TRINITY_DN5332_c0_g2_i1.p1  ORF type:complete len:1839 (+),score=349.04 TRINITY_DN5332_c0_g2_i1:125-5641(+)
MRFSSVVMLLLVALVLDLGGHVNANTCVMQDYDMDEFLDSPSKKAVTLTECPQYSESACCKESFDASLGDGSSALLQALTVTMLSDASSECTEALVKLNCVFCSPNQDKFLTVHSFGVSLHMCDAYCDSLYQVCGGATVNGERGLVKDVYPSGSEFCHAFPDPLQVYSDDAAGCYGTEPQCTSDDYRAEYTSCDHNNERKVVYVWKDNVQCDTSVGLPAPIKGLSCEAFCEAGQYLPIGEETCKLCDYGSFSIGGGERVDTWKDFPKALNPNSDLDFKSYCQDLRFTMSGSDKPDIVGEPNYNCKWMPDDTVVVTPALNNSMQAVLELSVQIQRPEATVSFAYRVSAEIRFDGLLFTVDDEMVMSRQDTRPVFKTMTYPLEKGFHTLKWIYRKDWATAGGEDRAMLDMVEVAGLRLTDNECSPCPGGTHSAEKGSSVCPPCKVNHYASASGGLRFCAKCPDDEFSYMGAYGCEKRDACTELDATTTYTNCEDGKRTKSVAWLRPRICNNDLDGAYTLPQDEEVECMACNPGQWRKPGTDRCQTCNEGEYSDGLVACAPCPDGTAAEKGIFYTNFDSWSELPNLYSNCTGDCGEGGWRMTAASVDSGIGHGSTFESWLQMTFEADYMGEISFLYSFDCSLDPCIADFVVADVTEKILSSNDPHVDTSSEEYEEWQERESWDESDPKKALHLYKHKLTSTGIHTMYWSFGGVNFGPVERNDRIILHEIRVTGTRTGGASSCEVCPPGTKSLDKKTCYPCRVGQSSPGGTDECSDCPENTFNDVEGGVCQDCGHGATAPKGSTECGRDCKYTLDNQVTVAGTNVDHLQYDMFDLVSDIKYKTDKECGHYYYLNVCDKDPSQTGVEHCRNKDGSAMTAYACQETVNGDFINLGTQMSFHNYEDNPTQGVVIKYTDGAYCSKSGEPRDIEITLHCDPERAIGVPKAKGGSKSGDGNEKGCGVEDSPCHYQFDWYSLYGCPVCTTAHYTSVYTQCEGKKMKKRYEWKSNPKDCHGGIPELPEEVLMDCDDADNVVCEKRGTYYNQTAEDCLTCPKGSYCVVGGEAYDYWTRDAWPAGFVTDGWTAQGVHYVQSGPGTTSLQSTMRFATAGRVGFRFRVDTFESSNSKFAFFVDDEIRGEWNSTEFDFLKEWVPVKDGTHELKWVFTNGAVPSKNTLERSVTIDHIVIEGRYKSCPRPQFCPAGSYADEEGSEECSPCPGGSETGGKSGQEMCTECDPDKYSFGGSALCKPRPQCYATRELQLQNDFSLFYTACVKNKRTGFYRELPPYICTGWKAKNYPNITESCSISLDGYFYDDDGKLATCESGRYWDLFKEKCVDPSDGYVALRQQEYFDSNMTVAHYELSDDFDTFCTPAEFCGTPGWRVRGDAVDSGFHEGEVDSVLDMKNFTMAADGTVSFEYMVEGDDLTNGLNIYIDGKPQKFPFHPAKWASFRIGLRAGEHSIRFVYHQELGNDQGLALVRDLVILGSGDGGSIEAVPCPAGTRALPDHTKCEVCPPGYFSEEGSDKCTQCDSGEVAATERTAQCLRCGSGTDSNKERTQCVTDNCKFTNKDKNNNKYVIDLSALASRTFGPVTVKATKSKNRNVYLNICESKASKNDTCIQRGGGAMPFHVCDVEEGTGYGHIIGSRLSASFGKAVTDGVTLDLKYDSSRSTALCPFGVNTTVHFFCPLTNKNYQEFESIPESTAQLSDDSSATCDVKITWNTTHACRKCDEDSDYIKQEAECNDGKEIVSYIKNAPCSGPAVLRVHEGDCQWTMKFGWYLLLGAAALFLILLLGFITVSVRNRSLVQRYELLAEEATAGGGRHSDFEMESIQHDEEYENDEGL